MYSVQGGDTLDSIAARFNLNPDTVIWTNQLGDGSSLQIGQSLMIPPTDGVLYVMHDGDKLANVVSALHGDLKQTIDYNLLRDPSNLAAGTMVMVPGAHFDPPPPPPPAASTWSAPTQPWTPPPVSRDSNPLGFIWPTAGYVSQGFSYWHHGIDIANGYGVPEYAAAAGTVSIAGWYYGYGLTVQIEHTGGFETRYGHMEQVLVSPGQYVAQGQVIGLMGCTGDCTGPHLHFEVHIGGVAVNPLNYLP
jgi:murein DD-endopeptidase MepM/ murein hydrolase activator NlpD